jgi:hypothetical protein
MRQDHLELLHNSLPRLITSLLVAQESIYNVLVELHEHAENPHPSVHRFAQRSEDLAAKTAALTKPPKPAFRLPLRRP